MMLNYQSTPRSNRSNGFVIKHVLHFALFAAFSLWLLYQVRQPNDNSTPRSQLSNEGISNFLGRKGSPGLLNSKSTPIPQSGLTLDDVTNPVEEGEISQFSKVIEQVEFHFKTISSKDGNDGNTLWSGLDGQTKANEDGSLTLKRSNISFPDENGIPQHIRDKFIGKGSSKSGKNTRVKTQSLTATRASKDREETGQ